MLDNDVSILGTIRSSDSSSINESHLFVFYLLFWKQLPASPRINNYKCKSFLDYRVFEIIMRKYN